MDSREKSFEKEVRGVGVKSLLLKKKESQAKKDSAIYLEVDNTGQTKRT